MQTDPQFSDEIRRFEEQYAENPDSLVFARLADLHRKAGRPERALEILDEGLERHPDYLSAHIVRARCLRALDRTRAAEDVFHHVLELDGENLVALRSLAEMAWERGDGETARDRLEELLELDPRNEEARDLLEEIRGGASADAFGAGPVAPDASQEPDDPFAERSEEAGAFQEPDDPFTADEGDDDAFVAEDDPFAAPDDPFADEETEEEHDAFDASDEPFADRDEGEPEAFQEPDDPFADGDVEEPEAFQEPDDPFAADEEDDDALVAEDDPFASEAEDAGAEDEDLIIEPTSRRETEDEVPEATPAEQDDEEAEEAPDGAAGSGFRTGSFRVEPVEGKAEAGAPEAEADDAGEETGEEEEEDDRWWDFLKPGGGADEPEVAPPEATEEPAGAAPADELGRTSDAAEAGDEAAGGPAVGPAEEAEELRTQIEELRVRAEQETDLSDAEEDLATETLANLYEAQGFYREAVEMYEELAAQRPDDEDLRRRLERAREALEETGEAAAREAAEAPAASPATGDVAETTADDAAAAHEAVVTAAGQLRAVLRGEASSEGRDSSAP